MDTQKHFYELLANFKSGMLVTRGAGDEIHARPMEVAELKPDAEAFFTTSIESPKIAEIEADPHVLLAFQSKSQFATLQGKAVVMRDRVLIDRLWSEKWRIFFPGGKDDPNLCILKVEPTAGEYWDDSGTQGLKYLFQGVKAIVQGRPPQFDARQHAKVKV